MTALERGERNIYSRWEGETLKQKGLDTIFVAPFASSRTEGYITIDYHFKGHDQLREEGKETPQF